MKRLKDRLRTVVLEKIETHTKARNMIEQMGRKLDSQIKKGVIDNHRATSMYEEGIRQIMAKTGLMNIEHDEQVFNPPEDEKIEPRGIKGGNRRRGILDPLAIAN